MGSGIEGISIRKWTAFSGSRSVYCRDEKALTAYIASLSAKPVYIGEFSDTGRRELLLLYAAQEDGKVTSRTFIQLCDGVLFADLPFDNTGRLSFVLEDKIDWDYIQSLLDLGAQMPEE